MDNLSTMGHWLNLDAIHEHMRRKVWIETWVAIVASGGTNNAKQYADQALTSFDEQFSLGDEKGQ